MNFNFFVSLIGKTVSKISRLKGGHGSALPGLIVEKISPNFLRDILEKLPLGVAVISGTNGKTTTTKMVVELLRDAGLKVFTNDSGSNFTRGVASSAIREMKRGKLNFDIAILELDEAHATYFIKQISPKYSLLLNVLRDQLDRFGEIDKTAKLLESIAKSTTKNVILNRDDLLISRISEVLNKQKISYFGYSPNLAKNFPSDEQLHYAKKTSEENKSAEVELIEFSGTNAIYKIDKKNYKAKLQMSGSHNVLNGAAALTLAKIILGEKAEISKMIAALEKIRPAFGRGEIIEINNQALELILVKNPSGFRIALASQYNENCAVMIAINDQYADGRDVSWLWDVDFSRVKNVAMISGKRAYDMALRLNYENISVNAIETNLRAALEKFLSENPNKPKQIYTTYTAMLILRKLLKKEISK